MLGKIRVIALSLVLMLPSLVFGADSSGMEAFRENYLRYDELSQQGKWSESLTYAKESYELGQSLFVAPSENLAALAYNYGFNLDKVDNKEDAKEVLKQTVGLYEASYGKDAVELVPALFLYGKVLATPYSEVSANRQFKRAIKLVKKNYGADSLEFAQVSVDIGLTFLNDARSPRAKKYLLDGYEVFTATLGKLSPRTGRAALHLGRYEYADHDFKNAVDYLNEAVQTFARPDEPSSQIELTAHGLLVQCYESLGKSEMATQHSLAIGRMTPYSDNQHLMPIASFPPEYPMSAAARGVEGWAQVSFTVDKEGFVVDPVLKDVEGSNKFGQESLKTIARFRFAPRFVDGAPVDTSDVEYVFKFKLAD